MIGTDVFLAMDDETMDIFHTFTYDQELFFDHFVTFLNSEIGYHGSLLASMHMYPNTYAPSPDSLINDRQQKI